MEVFLANEQDLPVSEQRLWALARHTLSFEQVEPGAELSILLVNPDHMRRLNARFAGDNHFTDVLAFPMDEEDEGSLLLGDVVICPRVAKDNAAQAGHSPDRELEVVLVHGTLHLLGYDHQKSDDKQEMERRLHDVLDSFTGRSDNE